MTALAEYIDKTTGGDAFLTGILNTFITADSAHRLPGTASLTA